MLPTHTPTAASATVTLASTATDDWSVVVVNAIITILTAGLTAWLRHLQDRQSKGESRRKGGDK